MIHHYTEDQQNYKMKILWTKTEEGARIERVFGQSVFLKLPSYIEGNPVTEIGPYCFSDSKRYSKEDAFITSEVDFPLIAGKYIEGIILPDSVTTLGNGAFYNCRSMRFLSIGKGLHRLGSDVFTNCLRLNTIMIRASSEEKTCLPLLLERMKTEMEIHFQPKEDVCECRLYFPECYEWFDDMVTAHVFNRVMIGEGFRMRQCFQNHRIQFSKYDQYCVNSLKLEEERDICKIAINRLRWPVSLKEEYRILYTEAIVERYDMLFSMILSERNMEELTFLCQYFKPGQDYLTHWLQMCIHADWVSGTSFLMEEKHKGSTFAEKSFDLEW